MIRKRVAILISGRGSNMAALIRAASEPTYPAEIALVISSREEAEGVKIAGATGIATEIVPHKTYAKDRQAFEGALQDVLHAHRIEFICLAGFTRLLTSWFVERWEARILNIHPALLPAFKGLDTHVRALREGVKIHGATVHFVVAEMDSGPIISQAAVPVLDDDTVSTLAARVLKVEHRIYPLALRLVVSGNTKIVDNRCIVDMPPCPNDEIIVPNDVSLSSGFIRRVQARH